MNTIEVPCRSCGARNRIPAAKQHLHPKCGRCGAAINLSAAAVPVELDDGSFGRFISSASLPVMVEFFSPSCGACRMLAPTVERLAGKFLGQAIIAKLDTSRNQLTAARFQIRGVPTLIFFKGGRIVDQITGAAPEQTLAQMLNRLL